jgi:hypothetical protein
VTSSLFFDSLESKNNGPPTVHVPRQLEVTAVEVHVPCRPFKRRVSSDTRQQMAILPEKAAGYPDVNRPSLVFTI